MPGLIELAVNSNGDSYPVYPIRQVYMVEEKKIYARRIKNVSMVALLVIIIAFFIYSAYTCRADSLQSRHGPKEPCVTEMLLFMGTFFLSMMALVEIGVTYLRCFVTQLVNCGMSKSNYIYLLLLSFFIPPVLTQFTACYVFPYTFKLVTCGFCSVLAMVCFGSIFYRRKHCQCKKCLGIKGVLLQYETTHLQFDEETKLDLAELKGLFNVSSECILIAIYVVGSDELIHTFSSYSPARQLQFGSYYLLVYEMGSLNTYAQTSMRICEPAPSPSDHLIPKSNELTYFKKNETIMNVD